MITKEGTDRAHEVAANVAGSGERGTTDGCDEDSLTFYVDGEQADVSRFLRFKRDLEDRGITIIGVGPQGSALALVFRPKAAEAAVVARWLHA